MTHIIKANKQNELIAKIIDCCEVMCCRCRRSTQFDISRKEYRQMDNRKPWTFEQEDEHGRY